MSEASKHNIESVVEEGTCYLRADHVAKMLMERAEGFRAKARSLTEDYDSIDDLPIDDFTALIALTCLYEEFEHLADTITIDVMRFMDGLNDN